jgi:CRISPR/Cas system-associated endonuclease Cas1
LIVSHAAPLRSFKPAADTIDRRRIQTMPFKSQAQRRKFAQLLVEGKISNETFEEWNRETGGRKLPERVKSTRRRTTRRKKVTRKGKK